MGWQDAVAVGVVFGALFYLSRLGWKGLIGGKAGGCAKCAVMALHQSKRLVSIGPARPSRTNSK